MNSRFLRFSAHGLGTILDFRLPAAQHQAGGLTELSRWLSEAWRATPPDYGCIYNRTPEGCQNPTPKPTNQPAPQHPQLFKTTNSH